MNRDDDMITLRGGNDAFLGLRGEPGIPDDVVVIRVCPGMKQRWHRRDEALVASVFQGPSQGIGDVRFEDNLRFHFSVGHFAIPLLSAFPKQGCKLPDVRNFLKVPQHIQELIDPVWLQDIAGQPAEFLLQPLLIPACLDPA